MSKVRKNALFDEPQNTFPTAQQAFPDPFNSGNTFTPSVSVNSAANPITSPSGAPTSGDSWFSAPSFMGAQDSTNTNLFPSISPAADLVLGIGVQQAYGVGKQYIDSGIGRYLSVFESLRKYFNVDNKYVLRKLMLILFPFRHKSWERKNRQTFPSDSFQASTVDPSVDSQMQHQRDINDPDLYIPLMSFVTYILLVGWVLGFSSAEFTPDVLASTATKGVVISLFEIGLIKLGFYILSVPTNLPFLDTTAYSGYKYVGIVLSILGAIFFGNYAYYPIAVVTSVFMVVFTLRALRKAGVHTSDTSMRVGLDENTKKRNLFIFIVALLQVPLSLILSFPYARQLIFLGFNKAVESVTGVPPVIPAEQQQATTLTQ